MEPPVSIRALPSMKTVPLTVSVRAGPYVELSEAEAFQLSCPPPVLQLYELAAVSRMLPAAPVTLRSSLAGSGFADDVWLLSKNVAQLPPFGAVPLVL